MTEPAQALAPTAPEGTKSRTAATEVGTLFRHSSHYLGGRVGLMLLGFISFPLFTRIFTVAEYGQIDLVLKIVLMVTVLSKLGIQHSVLRLYDEHAGSAEPGALRRYHSTFFFGALLAAAPVSILYWFIIQLLSHGYLSKDLTNLLSLSCVLVFTGAVKSILIGFLRAQQRTHLFNVIEVLTKAATLAFTCALLFGFQRSAYSFVIGTIMAETSGIVAMTVIIGRGKMIAISSFSISLLRRILSFGVPMIGYEFSNFLLDSGDRILVQSFLGSTALGYYSAAYNIAGYVQELLMNPVNLAIFPIYVKLWNTSGAAATGQFLSRSLEIFLYISIAVIGLATVGSQDAVRLLASAKFLEAHRLVPMLVAAFILFAAVLFLQAGLCLFNKTVIIAKITLATALVNLALNVLLLKPCGIWGAVIATFGGYLLLAILTCRASAALLPLRINFWAIGRCLLACAAATLVSFHLNTGILVATLCVKALVFCSVYFGILYIWEPGWRSVVNEIRLAVGSWRIRPLSAAAGDR